MNRKFGKYISANFPITVQEQVIWLDIWGLRIKHLAEIGIRNIQQTVQYYTD